jgi:hypothetical protein
MLLDLDHPEPDGTTIRMIDTRVTADVVVAATPFLRSLIATFGTNASLLTRWRRWR